MCEPEIYDKAREGAKNRIILEEECCYSQLASRLDINSGLIEDLIIGYCMDRPPRFDSSPQSRPNSCPPPP
jgi:regulatory protein YycH of two-component signal transduction system YycFG